MLSVGTSRSTAAAHTCNYFARLATYTDRVCDVPAQNLFSAGSFLSGRFLKLFTDSFAVHI